jgi:hypothetical protein
MNLDKLNVVELNAQEAQETDGGLLILLGLLVPYAIQATVVTGLAAGIAGSFQGAYKAVRN